MMINPGFPTYCYRVDACDDLVWVDAAWLAFARENGAAELTEKSVQGRSLWEFIADATTQSLYQEIHRRIRLTGQSSVIPIRCDSPNLKRQMQLTISCEPEGALHYRSVLLRVELQPRFTLLEPSTKRTADELTMCSCCKKCLVEPTDWVELEIMAARLNLLENETAPCLLYSVCPGCTDAARSSSH
ncbi:hypothetical protein [Symmachiella dynata]|uniref:hypothetical protein n=1 Tax=Symmachiella dynata TaxID=2527995 RepID=UPI0030EEA2C2|tara:strand:+ start:633 stop:1193 length:561 start_codon:yes stop_codon:yes gene_type:complete